MHDDTVTEERVGNGRREIKKRGRETAAPIEVEDASVAAVEPRWKKGNGKLEREKWTEAVMLGRVLPPRHHPAAASRAATLPPLVPEEAIVPSLSLEPEPPLHHLVLTLPSSLVLPLEDGGSLDHESAVDGQWEAQRCGEHSSRKLRVRRQCEACYLGSTIFEGRSLSCEVPYRLEGERNTLYKGVNIPP
ncbi:hypothetical protein PIB30_054887 [Stylosanthes scabra]|uniref:Uncharacterized protein n=1 Tax=Stylosanthes scabra TaxID=79078 RepID=A0ABU6ZHK9_9FABA|nr:hypothetical protein [Stylosanthes scabra]